jgi:2-polyprenyl-6-methoxyphenol hydroxylase-like FAD-dependent oxidoreductase
MPATPLLGQRAVVLGASFAGLLAARVLSEHYTEVVLLERDDLPERALPRKGTPHAVHPHGLLARGRVALEELFPGFTQAMVDRGGLLGDLHRDAPFDVGGQRFAPGVAGQPALAVSRLAIEAELRHRVLALPNVRAITGVDVLAPVLDAGGLAVVGARYATRDATGAEVATSERPVQVLAADFTIDCTGRASRTPAWLASWSHFGYEPPVEEKVEVGICYTSAYFKRIGACAHGAVIDKVAVICGVTNQLPRPGVLIAQEPAEGGVPRWVVAVGGYAGDHAPATIEAMREFALAIGSPELVRVTHEAEQIGPVIRYQFPHNLRRHYERLARFPQRYLALGDALTSFNPIYGQGMTVAACEALVLRSEMQRGLAGLNRRYFKAAARVVDTPWQLAVGADLSIDAVVGHRPLPVRLVNAYIARLQRVAPNDAVVAQAFLKVVHMLEAPPTLFSPRILARVLWKGARNPPPRPAAAVRALAG